MENFVILAVLIISVGSASFYIWKEKKKGKKCIGCPMSGCCKSCKCGQINKSTTSQENK